MVGRLVTASMGPVQHRAGGDLKEVMSIRTRHRADGGICSLVTRQYPGGFGALDQRKEENSARKQANELQGN